MSTDWLLTGKENTSSNARVIDSVGFMNVPLVHVKARCGYLDEYFMAEYIDELPTMPVIVDKTYKGKYRLFEADGDSMDDNTRSAYVTGI